MLRLRINIGNESRTYGRSGSGRTSPFALSSAGAIAMGACRIADSARFVDMLSFGSECSDVSVLEEAAGAVEYAVQTDEFFMMRKGASYPAALKQTVERIIRQMSCKRLQSQTTRWLSYPCA